MILLCCRLENTQASLLLVSLGVLRRLEALMVSSAEEPSAPCTESEDHLSKMAIRQDRPTEAGSRATGSVDMEECHDLGWPEVHGFCARQ